MATPAVSRTIEMTPENAAVSTGGARMAFRILQFGFIVLPIIAGIDKFTNLLVDWTLYLSPPFWRLFGSQLMLLVGVVEIAAGLAVAFLPRYGAYLVAAWLGAIIVNLFSFPGPVHGDIILRDFGLALAALALAQLAEPTVRMRTSRLA